MVLCPHSTRLTHFLNCFLMLVTVVILEFQGPRPFKIVVKELSFVYKLLYIEKPFIVYQRRKCTAYTASENC